MNRLRVRHSVLWPGEEALAEIEAAIARGEAVDVVLPASEQHSLCVHLGIDAAEPLALEGGAELLARMAALRELAELESVIPALRRAGYRAELAGPPPVLSLVPATA